MQRYSHDGYQVGQRVAAACQAGRLNDALDLTSTLARYLATSIEIAIANETDLERSIVRNPGGTQLGRFSGNTSEVLDRARREAQRGNRAEAINHLSAALTMLLTGMDVVIDNEFRQDQMISQSRAASSR